MEDELILSEQDRSKLDGIVSSMIANKESDANIQFVVNDFKQKYSVKKKEPSEASVSQPLEEPSVSDTFRKQTEAERIGIDKTKLYQDAAMSIIRQGVESGDISEDVVIKNSNQPENIFLAVASARAAKDKTVSPEQERAAALLQNRQRSGEVTAPLESELKTLTQRNEQQKVERQNQQLQAEIQQKVKQAVIDSIPEDKAGDKEYIQKIEDDLFLNQGLALDITGDRKINDQGVATDAIASLAAGLGSLNLGFRSVTDKIVGAFGIPVNTELPKALLDESRRNTITTFEQDFYDSVKDGNFSNAARQAINLTAESAPLTVAAGALSYTGSPYAAYATVSALASVQTYGQVQNEEWFKELSPLAQLGYISSTGAAEGVGEMAGGRVLNRAIRGLANSATKEASQKALKEYITGMIRAGAINVSEESIGEGITGGSQYVIDALAKGEAISANGFIDAFKRSAAAGAAMAGVISTPTSAASTASYLANKIGSNYQVRKIDNAIKSAKESLLSTENPEDHSVIVSNIVELQKIRNNFVNADVKFYENMSDEDRNRIFVLNAQVEELSNKNKVTTSEEAKNIIKQDVAAKIEEIKQIESRYDRKEEAGVPSPVVEGEAVVEAQPVEGASQEAPEAGGVLQVPVEEVAIPEVSEFIDRRVSYTTPDGRAIEGFLYDEGAGKLVVEDDLGNKYDLGNVEEVGGSIASELNISQAATEDFDINDEGNFVVRGTEYVNKYSDPLAAIQRDQDGNVISVTLDTTKGEKRTFRGAVADTIAYNISLSQKAQTPEVVTEAVQETGVAPSTVIAAPFFNVSVNTLAEARNLRKTPEYKEQQNVISRQAKLTGVNVLQVDESIGGFENAKGEQIIEVSNIIRVTGSKEDVDKFAAMMGVMSVETQEATIAADYVKAGSENHNADELTFTVSDVDGAIQALKTQGFYDFTINDSESTITILDFSLGEDAGFRDRIGNLAIQFKLQKINYEAKERRALDSRYISPEARTRILGQLQEDSLQRGQAGTELGNEVSEAIRRNQEIISELSGEQPSVVVEETVEQVQAEPSAETVVEETVQEPSGVTVDDVYNSYKESIKPKISPKTFIESAKKQLIDRQSKIKNAVIDLGLRNAYDRIVNKAGASARANDKYNRAEKNIYGGLNEKDIETLDKIIFNRRVIQIDENFDKRRLDAEARVKSAQNELSNWMSSNIGKKSESALKQKKEIQDKLSQAKKDVEASKRPKHPLGFKSEDARRDLDGLKQSIGEEKYNDLVRKSDLYFEEFRSTLKDLYDAGLVSEEMYNDLRTNNYQPRKFLEHVYDFENSEFLIRDFGLSQDQIKSIQEGSEKDLIMSSRFLLGSYLLSASKRIFANRANKAIAEGIGKEGSNDWVRSLNEKADPDAGFTKVYFFEDGVQQQFQLRSDLKNELDNLSSLSNVDGKVGKFFSMMSGTPLIKLMATRANPLFAFKNFPRDLGHILFFTNIYDKHNLYYATYLVFRDFLKGLKSSIQDTQDFKDYMDLGGGMDFISIQGRDGNFISKSAVNKTVEKIGKLGEWSEVGFRIGVYKRFKDDAIAEFEKKNGAKPEGEDLLQIKERAVAKSREVIDFSQGGEAVKAADKFVPYLNAAFQGFRVGATYVANNPKTFASKFVQAQMGLLALSFLNSLIGDEDELEDIPEHTRLMNFVIFLPSTRIDEDGKERRKYILIPKTQQAAPFFALMDVANRKILNDVFGKEYNISEDEYTYIVNGIRKGLPIGDDAPIKEIQSLIPVINAATTYSSNYDSFRDRMITMDKDKVLPAFENINDPNVEQFYKVIGEVAGISPIRTKVATEKLITGPNSSFIVGMSYGLLDAIARQYPLEGGEYDIKTAESKAQNVAKQTGLNFSKAFVRETDPSWKLYNQKETLDEIDLRAGTERARLRQKAKELAKGTNTTANLNKSVAEAEKFATEVAKKNPSDARYFVESFRANVKKSPASQEAVEIKFSTTDKSRAEKIKLLYNPQNREDFINIASDVYRETGYRVSSKTLNEYEKLYGKLK